MRIRLFIGIALVGSWQAVSGTVLVEAPAPIEVRHDAAQVTVQIPATAWPFDATFDAVRFEPGRPADGTFAEVEELLMERFLGWPALAFWMRFDDLQGYAEFMAERRNAPLITIGKATGLGGGSGAVAPASAVFRPGLPAMMASTSGGPARHGFMGDASVASAGGSSALKPYRFTLIQDDDEAEAAPAYRAGRPVRIVVYRLMPSAEHRRFAYQHLPEWEHHDWMLPLSLSLGETDPGRVIVIPEPRTYALLAGLLALAALAWRRFTRP